jgi:hypothetical protein
MLGPASPDAPGDVAELREEDGWFVITLRRTSGETLGEKRLPGSLACAVRAEAAAVSIAALEGQLGGVEPQPLSIAPPLEAPVAAAPPPEAPAATLAEEPPAAEAPAPLGAEVGAAVLASWNGTDLAPGARVEVALGRAGASWAFVLAGLAVGAHGLAVPPGDASWRRLGGELALRDEIPLGRAARVQVAAGVAFTALVVEGRGFSRNTGAALFDPGAALHLRLVPVAGRFRPWVGLAGAYWPRSHQLVVSGADARGEPASVPGVELFAGVGASFGGNR